MLRQDFNFELPPELIARYPAKERTHSRLLRLDGVSGELSEGHFYDVLDLINPGDLLVFNNTRVIPARLFGKKESGGAFELLIERVTGEHTALAHIRSSRSPKPGARLLFDNGYAATMVSREGDLFELEFDGASGVLAILDDIGHIPLPPYIDRPDTGEDRERYQTVYARNPGAVAAPTAGLHFDEALLEKLQNKGVSFAWVTLHVGAGTFQPVKEDDILRHHMHSEYAVVPPETVAKIRETKKTGGRVIAVGTTSVRSLESAALASEKNGGDLAPFASDTSIFIYPGYRYRVIDALITNFHLPESTLIMLVAAFAGYRHTMAAYRYAVENRFRFFSYGDAMFITRNPEPESREEIEQMCEHKESL